MRRACHKLNMVSPEPLRAERQGQTLVENAVYLLDVAGLRFNTFAISF